MNIKSAMDKNYETKMSQISERFQNDAQHLEKHDKYQNIEQHIGKIVLLSAKDIEIDDNCRKKLDTNSVAFQQLISSIKGEGILQNLVVEVRSHPFRLVCTSGQRRLSAAWILGIEKVQCLLKAHKSQHQSIANSLAENLLRENLITIDIADSYLKLFEAGWDDKKIASHFEKEVRTVRYYLVLARFSENIKDIIRQHPSIFTTRVLINEFAKKTWTSEEDLKKSILNKLSSEKRTNIKTKTEQLKEKNRIKFEEYAKQKKFNEYEKELIRNALGEFGFLKRNES